jgi:hypothetical protein
MALPVSPENEAMVVRQLLANHAAVLKELQQWRSASTKGTTHE